MCFGALPCRERTVSKEYLALTVGVPQPQCFTVNAPIGRHPMLDTARRIHPDGKPALTEFQVGGRVHSMLSALQIGHSLAERAKPCILVIT